MPARHKSGVSEVAFTRPEKVFFPRTGFTKGEVIQYYLDVAPHLLPHLRDRPVTLIRFPDGVTGERFYEKNVPRFAPAWITTVDVRRRHEEGSIRYILINDARTLAWCANLAALELHPFLHRARRLDCPTAVVFDLDPGEGAKLKKCAEVAFLIREIADQLKLQIFPKVSGSKGLQLYIPLNTPTTYAATGAFARAVAQLLERKHPRLVVSSMAKVHRRGRVLIDWSQNNPSKTTVAVYSLRGKGDKPWVSMPVTWPELRRIRGADPLRFSPREALARLRRKGDLFAPLLNLKQKLPQAFAASAAEPDSSAQGGNGVAPRLAAYAAKRDFKKTAEPPPKATTPRRGSRFVIQKHAASHLHYDFRLEMNGTLKSWAVPKGLSTEPGVKRAAFEVEDHPLSYFKFEGTIPKGQYGGGTVMVWDLGTYEVLGGDLGRGDLKIRLTGKKLRGEWHLFRIRVENGKAVWLIVRAGPPARAIGARRDDQSALTGRTMEQIGHSRRQWHAA